MSSSKSNHPSRFRNPCARDHPHLASNTDSDTFLRFREEPYTGLIDCGKKIAQEEGWTALFRLWWIDAILLIFATGVAELLLATAGL